MRKDAIARIERWSVVMVHESMSCCVCVRQDAVEQRLPAPSHPRYMRDPS